MEIRRPARFSARFLASLLDSLIVTGVVLTFITFVASDQLSDLLRGLMVQLLYTAYSTLVPSLWHGYDIGKRICKIRIRRYKDNEFVTFPNMILREFVGRFLLTFLTFGISIIISIFMVIFRDDKRAIHDFIGGTYVSED
ncbi:MULTISPECIES: RDD family protein [Bacillus]|uniref:RDD family protein n=1 Tax=Bacillus TaxID=1386 RepID=UPI001D0D008F|nr:MULTISPECIES: RDD family protein [Bacillus]